MTTEPIESKPADPSVAVTVPPRLDRRALLSPSGNEASQTRPQRPAPVPPLDPVVGIELRVTRAGMPARRLRINSTQCTFGSGEGCTVRLSDSSLRPLHAVILHENGHTMIRGYSVPLEVNGESVSESSLGLGDVVRLGNYCFELIDLPISEAAGHCATDAVPQQTGPGESGRLAGQPEAETQDGHASPGRFKFSQTPEKPRSTPVRRSHADSVLAGIAGAHASDSSPAIGQSAGTDAAIVREPAVSLAQIHVQAKRNSELMAELAAANKREQEVAKALAATKEQVHATELELGRANQALTELTAEMAALRERVDQTTREAAEKQSAAVAEQAKLNRTIAALRESVDASQKAEAATRQTLQESIRQRDEAFAQRASAIDSQQSTRTQLDEAEAEIGRLKRSADQHASERERMATEADQARMRIDELKDVCCGQADQITKLNGALEASQTSELAAVKRLNETIETLQAELETSRQRIKAADLQRVQLNTLQSTLDSTLQQHLADKLGWGNQVEALNQQIVQLQADLQTERTELHRSQTAGATYQAQVAELRAEVEAIRSELTTRPAAEELQAVSTRLVERESELANRPTVAQLDEVKTRLAEREAELANRPSRAQWEEVSGRLAECEAELASRPSVEQLDELAAQLAQTEQDRENNERQLAQLRADYDELASQKVAAQPVEAKRRSEEEPVVSTDDVAESQWQPFSSQANVQPADDQPTGDRPSDADSAEEEPSVVESVWRMPSSALLAAADEPLSDEASTRDTSDEPLHSPTFVMETPAEQEETSCTQPMQFRAEGDHPSAVLPESAAFGLVERTSGTPVEREAEQESAADDVDPQAMMAALIQRSEGTASHWFADYTARSGESDAARVQSEAGSVEPEDGGDEADDEDVMARLSQYVQESASIDDELGQAIAASEHGNLDPEASALSLARMLINELDAVTQSDHDLSSVPLEPEPTTPSKRLVAAAIAEVGDDVREDRQELAVPQADGRRKGFDERAFRDSFAGSQGEEIVDPNADETAYLQDSNASVAEDSKRTESANTPDDEEDSVEAYMNQLLRRMGQEPPASSTSAPASMAVAAEPVRQPKRERPEVVRPKRTAPELEVPLDQMRELANESAESAISTSARKGAKELRKRAMVDGVQGGVVVLCALVFFYCGMTSSNLGLVWNTAGALALGLSVFFFYEMFRKLATTSRAN